MVIVYGNVDAFELRKSRCSSANAIRSEAAIRWPTKQEQSRLEKEIVEMRRAMVACS